MIKKLQLRLILITMVSLLMVLAAFAGSINLINYYFTVNEADRVLDILSMYEGRLPTEEEDEFASELPDYSSPEEPYENRYFSVLLDGEGGLVAANTDMIAAIDEDTATSYAQRALESGRERGFLEDYRFVVQNAGEGTRVSFVDWGRRLDTCRTFLITSLWISLAVMLAVLALVTVLSGRFIKPIAESYEKQRRFITDAGHELKTPLSIIDADVSLIEMENGQSKWIEDIQTQVKRLSSLTNNLIYLARMQETDPLQMIDFPLSDMVEEMAGSFEGPALKQNKKFTTDIQPLISMHGDEYSIRRLISILLDNAVKYSDENGEIRVTLSKKGRSIELGVYNTTDEISKEDLPRLFDRFYRADLSRNSFRSGYGIGLSIASAIVSAHRGKIQATSKDEKSLNITVTFPNQ